MTDSAKQPPLSREELEAHDRLLRARADRFAADLRGVGMQEGDAPAPCEHRTVTIWRNAALDGSTTVTHECDACGALLRTEHEGSTEAPPPPPPMPTKAQIDRLLVELSKAFDPELYQSKDGFRLMLYRAAGIEGTDA